MGNHKKLSDEISQDMFLARDVWEYARDYAGKVLFDQFPALFVKMIEHSYVGHTPSEIISSIAEIPDISFLKQRYTEIDAYKNEIISMYPDEIAKIKYRYHLMVRAGVFGKKVLSDSLNLAIYNFYRMLRGRERLENWKMPY